MGMFYESESDNVEADYTKSFNAPALKEKTGLLTRAGMGLARGFLKSVKGFGIAAAPFTTSNAEDEASWAENFNFLDQTIKKVTPDPDSVGLAGHLVDAISELPGQLVMGAPGLINSVVMNTGADLVDQGVDAKTATLAAVGTGVVTGGMMMIPGAGKTLAQTAGAVVAQPILGAGQRGATKLYLENQGYEEQAKAFDPLNPKAMLTDAALATVFGVLGYQAHQVKGKPLAESVSRSGEAGVSAEQLRGMLPVQVEDSLDTFANHQKARRATPFDEEAAPGMAEVHLEAFDKALDDVIQGRPVDVAPILQAARGDLIAGAEERAAVQAEGLHGGQQGQEGAPGAAAEPFQDFLQRKDEALSRERAGFSQLSRDELFAKYEMLSKEEQTLEGRVLGSDLEGWRKAQRQLNSRDDARVAAAETEIARIEAKLPKADVKKLYGEGEVGHSADDIREYVNAIDAIGGETPGELAQSLKFAVTKLNGKTNPAEMDATEFSAYLQMREGMHVAAEKGWDTNALSEEVIKAAASRFSDPADAMYMLQGFLKKKEAPVHFGDGPVGIPYRREPPPEEIHARDIMEKELAALDSERTVETQFVAGEGQELTHGVARESDAFKGLLRESGVEENSPAWNDLVGKFEGGLRVRAIDPMTGFQTRAEFALSKPHIWERVQKAKQGSYTEFDIANVGGMNENIGEIHTDRVITDIAGIIKGTFQEHGIVDAQLFRNGGDELQVISLASPEAQAKAAQVAQAKVAEYVQENGLQDAFGKTSPGMPKNTTKAGTGLYQATVDIYEHASMADAIDQARIALNREKVTTKGAVYGQELTQGTRVASLGEQPGGAFEGAGAERTGDSGPSSGAGAEPNGGTQGHGVDEMAQAHVTGESLAPEAPLSLSKEPLGYDVETIFAERGDMVMVADLDAKGNPTAVTSARQLIAEATADIEKTRAIEKAYKRAAFCLGLD